MTPLIRIQTQDIDITSEVAALSMRSGDVGAIATFTGHVRAVMKDGSVVEERSRSNLIQP